MGKILIAMDAAEKALAAEFERTESLRREAWKYALGIAIVLGFQLRDIRTLVESPSSWVKILVCLSLAVLGAAFALVSLGLRARGYGQYPRGNKLWENLKPDAVSESAAQEALVQMLLQTREQNARLNDAKTRILNWCGWLLLAGVLLVAGSQVLDAFENWI
jgi:hypothetical protein